MQITRRVNAYALLVTMLFLVLCSSMILLIANKIIVEIKTVQNYCHSLNPTL